MQPVVNASVRPRQLEPAEALVTQLLPEGDSALVLLPAFRVDDPCHSPRSGDVFQQAQMYLLPEVSCSPIFARYSEVYDENCRNPDRNARGQAQRLLE